MQRLREPRFSVSCRNKNYSQPPSTENKMASNYQVTISKAQTVMHVTNENFGSTEQKFAREKLKLQETNLPGFSELKIDLDLHQ